MDAMGAVGKQEGKKLREERVKVKRKNNYRGRIQSQSNGHDW
jgi:hypothetical protein